MHDRPDPSDNTSKITTNDRQAGNSMVNDVNNTSPGVRKNAYSNRDSDNTSLPPLQITDNSPYTGSANAAEHRADEERAHRAGERNPTADGQEQQEKPGKAGPVGSGDCDKAGLLGSLDWDKIAQSLKKAPSPTPDSNPQPDTAPPAYPNNSSAHRAI